MMNLRKFRNSKGLQRKFVASKLKISCKHLNDIEAGRVNLTDNVALRFSNFYGINIEKIREMYKEGKNDQIRYCK